MTSTCIKWLAASAVACSSLAAQASLVTVSGTLNANNELLGGAGAGTVDFSFNAMGLFDLTQAKVTPAGPGVSTTYSQDMDGVTISSKVTNLPLQSITYDSSTGNVVNEQLGGTFVVTTPNIRHVATGGTLAISDLRLDLTTGIVFGTTVGTSLPVNGVANTSTLTDVPLFTTSSIPAAPNVNGAFTTSIPPVSGSGTYCGGYFGGYYGACSGGGTGAPVQTLNAAAVGASFADLSPTMALRDAFTSAFGYSVLGKSALNAVTSFGNITVVPEASTYSMMLLGLAGLAFAKRHTRRD